MPEPTNITPVTLYEIYELKQKLLEIKKSSSFCTSEYRAYLGKKYEMTSEELKLKIKQFLAYMYADLDGEVNLYHVELQADQFAEYSMNLEVEDVKNNNKYLNQLMDSYKRVCDDLLKTKVRQRAAKMELQAREGKNATQ